MPGRDKISRKRRARELAAGLARAGSLRDDLRRARRELPGTRPVAAAAEAFSRHAALLAQARKERSPACSTTGLGTRSSCSCSAGRARAGAGHVRLTGPPQPTPWDPQLGEVMAATGRVIYEESVAEALIADLSGGGY
jgi:Protein of unknown function C-terminus (DUF2399)